MSRLGHAGDMMMLSCTNSAVHLIKLSSTKSSLNSTINSNGLNRRQPKPASERRTKASIIRAKPTRRREIRCIRQAMSDDRCSPAERDGGGTTRSSRVIPTTDRMNAADDAAALVNQCENCGQQTGAFDHHGI